MREDLGGRHDGGFAMCMRHGCGGDDDAERDRLLEDHADHGINADALESFAEFPAMMGEFPAIVFWVTQFLDFLVGLPEEQIGTDRCAQYRDVGDRVLGVRMDIRNERSVQYLQPWNLDDENGRRIDDRLRANAFK